VEAIFSSSINIGKELAHYIAGAEEGA
jgi:hypothetical protein